MQKKIALLQVILILSLLGCTPERPPLPKNYKEFDFRTFKGVTIEPGKSVTVKFKVYEIDEFVSWDINWEPIEVTLMDPNGNYYPWKRTRDPVEGLQSVFHFEAINPTPGIWQMTFTSKRIWEVYCSVAMFACSDTEGAYNKNKK